MVLKHLAGTFLTLGLYGCSLSSDFSGKSSDFSDSFSGRRVAIFYATGPNGGGPTSNEEGLYSRPVPSNSKLLEGVITELEGRKAFVLPLGVFRGNYSQAIALHKSPASRKEYDSIVIADTPAVLNGDVNDVFFAVPDGNKYNFERAGKQ